MSSPLVHLPSRLERARVKHSEKNRGRSDRVPTCFTIQPEEIQGNNTEMGYAGNFTEVVFAKAVEIA